MQAQDEARVTSKAKLWSGRIIKILTVAFLLFDAMVKVLNLPVAVEGTVKLGYPAGLVMWVGIVELICLGVFGGAVMMGIRLFCHAVASV